MEATGVYWRPVWHVLSDGEFQLILANAAHVKNGACQEFRVRAGRTSSQAAIAFEKRSANMTAI